jgi:hypothetical protein
MPQYYVRHFSLSEVQCDSKLLSEFPWPIIFKIKLLTEYESVTQKVLFDNVLDALMFGRKYDVITQNGDCSRESYEII